LNCRAGRSLTELKAKAINLYDSEHPNFCREISHINRGGGKLKGQAHAIWKILLLLIFFTVPGYATSPPKDQPHSITEMSVEELMEIEIGTVYGASKFEQKITQAPASVSIITSADIMRYGYRTLADVLQSVRGFYVSGDRNYNYLGIRGFSRPGDYNSRVLLLIDGKRINDNVYQGAPLGTDFPLDVDLISRVEVIRGPSSSLYGSNAFFGVINVITRRAVEIGGFEVSAEAASYDTYKERITYGGKFRNGLEMVLSGSYSKSKGDNLYFREFDTPATNSGRVDHADYDGSRSLFADLKFKDFTVQGAYTLREKGVPTASFGTVFNTNHTKTTDEVAYVDLKYEKSLDALTDIMARVSYNYYGYRASFLYDYPPLTLNRDHVVGSWWGGEVKAVRTILDRHRLTVGVEYEDDILQKQRNYDENPYAQYLNDQRGSYYYALYAQDEFSILDNLVFNAGVRHDHYKSFGGTTNPRLALIYNPWKLTTLKLLYGEAFRAPNANELYYEDGGISTKANPNLEPETIKSLEIVLEQYLYGYRFTSSAFLYRIKNLITMQGELPTTLLSYQNVGDVEARGIEMELEKRWGLGVEGRISYSFQEVEDRDTGRTLTNSPKHLAKANMYVPIFKEKLATGIELQYTGPRKTYEGNDAGGALVANLTLLSRNPWKDITISGSVYNLFDKKYSDPVSAEHQQSAIEQNGRNFRIKVTYRF
jgi:outer membrane receptor for ferrienterochelin and colicins